MQFDHLVHRKPEVVRPGKASRRREDKGFTGKRLLWVGKRSRVRINRIKPVSD